MAECCETMREQLAATCADHPDRFDCPDTLVHRLDSGVVGIVVHDGSGSVATINFCPWCAAALNQEQAS